jgi:hypothetical protein
MATSLSISSSDCDGHGSVVDEGEGCVGVREFPVFLLLPITCKFALSGVLWSSVKKKVSRGWSLMMNSS